MAKQGIQSDPAVLMGKPVVEGTRVTVEFILEELGAGQTIEQLLEAHPRLTRDGVLVAVRFGAKVLRADGSLPRASADPATPVVGGRAAPSSGGVHARGTRSRWRKPAIA